MKKRLIVAAILGIAAGNLANPTPRRSVASQSPAAPLLISAEIIGNNLFLAGFNFDENATAYINLRRRDTILDVDSQGKVLKVKKGGKRIRVDEANTIYVANGDGQISNPIRLFRTEEFVARLIQFLWHPELGFIHLKVGGYLLVDSRAGLSADEFDRDILMRTDDLSFGNDDFRLYRALREGDTGFTISQLFSTNGGPPPPPIIWRLGIRVE